MVLRFAIYRALSVTHGQTKNPAHIVVSRVWKFYGSSITRLPPVYPIWVLDPDTLWIG